MRRTGMLLLVVAVSTLLACGAAVALTRDCDGGLCKGTHRADLLRGSEVYDKILGEPGNDDLYGRDGDDMIKGGSGRDEIYGEGGNDRVKGSQGADLVSGGEGDDLVRAGLHDRVNDGVRDVLDCGPGTDTVYFVDGQDKVMDNCEILNP